MSGAGFLMAVNFFIAQCFCFFFLAVSVRSRNRIAARWFAGTFAVSSLSILFEFFLANFPPPRLWTVLAFESILAGAFMLRVGIGHLYGCRANHRHLAAIFSGFVLFNYVIYDLPRGTLVHALTYQAPLAIAVAMSAWAVSRARFKALVDRMLVVLLVMTSVHFPLKAAIAVHAGSGSLASDYLSSRFALYSQSIGAVLIVTIGLVLLCVLVLEIMADEKANAEVDVLSGVLNRRGFDNRVDALMEQKGPHSIVLCDLDRFKSSGCAWRPAPAPVRRRGGGRDNPRILRSAARRLAEEVVRARDRLVGDQDALLGLQLVDQTPERPFAGATLSASPLMIRPEDGQGARKEKS
jgi:hypothetical protein